MVVNGTAALLESDKTPAARQWCLCRAIGLKRNLCRSISGTEAYINSSEVYPFGSSRQL